MDALAVEEIAALVERQTVPCGEGRKRPGLGDLLENGRPVEVVGNEDETLGVDPQFLARDGGAGPRKRVVFFEKAAVMVVVLPEHLPDALGGSNLGYHFPANSCLLFSECISEPSAESCPVR